MDCSSDEEIDGMTCIRGFVIFGGDWEERRGFGLELMRRKRNGSVLLGGRNGVGEERWKWQEGVGGMAVKGIGRDAFQLGRCMWWLCWEMGRG